MNQSRAGHTATLLGDGRVLIAGGRGDKSSELYDPESHQFVVGPEMVEARSGHSATLLPDGTVLIAGGWDPDYKPLSSAQNFRSRVEPIRHHRRYDRSARGTKCDAHLWPRSNHLDSADTVGNSDSIEYAD